MERLIFTNPCALSEGEDLELRIGRLPAAAGVLHPPTPIDIARAISSATGEWFEQFLGYLAAASPNRAMQVASVAERAQMRPDGIGTREELDEELQRFDDLSEEFGGRREHAYEDIKEKLQALRELESPAHFHAKLSQATLSDLHGDDIDPGFGVDPEDSGRLLELRQAIDSYLGWPDQETEEAGDYLNRIRSVGDGLYNVARAVGDLADLDLARGILRSLIRTTDSEARTALDIGELNKKMSTFKKEKQLEHLRIENTSLRKRVNGLRRELRRRNRDAALRGQGERDLRYHLASLAGGEKLDSLMLKLSALIPDAP